MLIHVVLLGRCEHIVVVVMVVLHVLILVIGHLKRCGDGSGRLPGLGRRFLLLLVLRQQHACELHAVLRGVVLQGRVQVRQPIGAGERRAEVQLGRLRRREVICKPQQEQERERLRTMLAGGIERTREERTDGGLDVYVIWWTQTAQEAQIVVLRQLPVVVRVHHAGRPHTRRAVGRVYCLPACRLPRSTPPCYVQNTNPRAALYYTTLRLDLNHNSIKYEYRPRGIRSVVLEQLCQVNGIDENVRTRMSAYSSLLWATHVHLSIAPVQFTLQGGGIFGFRMQGKSPQFEKRKVRLNKTGH